jgi:hypothetical protein
MNTVERIEGLCSKILDDNNCASGTQLNNEPLRAEFIEGVKKFGVITQKDVDELERDNFHTALQIIIDCGLVSKSAELIDGKIINEARTLKTIYDNDSISVIIGDEYLYIKSCELLKLLRKAKFRAVKKKVHTYLEVAEE